MTDRERLQQLVLELRARAAPIGPLHSFWDYIFDIEAHLKGEPTILIHSTKEWVAIAEKNLRA